MKLGNIVRLLVFIILLPILTACANLITSAVNSSIVFAVAYHDRTVEKKQKKYTATYKCFIKNKPDAYQLGNAIAHGMPATAQYNKILSRTGEDIDPVQPHQLAYGFFLIANKLRDIRAKERMSWLEKYMPEHDIQEIRSIINDKYLSSYLEKCFYVPDHYKRMRTTRQIILDQRKNNFKNPPK